MTMPRRVAPQAPTRRGWCPSLARPMPTGDGLLARVHPPLGRLTPRQAEAVAEAARTYGNGHIDVTARANLQIRGVGEATRAALAKALGAVGLGDVRDDGGPQRLTLTDPRAGLDADAWIDVEGLARAIEAAGVGIAGLPPKTLVAIEARPGRRDGPGSDADLRLVAIAPGTLALGLAAEEGSDWFGGIAEGGAPARVASILRDFARSGARRLRDLAPEARRRLAGELPPAPEPTGGAEAARPGLARAGEGLTLALDAPFGRCTADALLQLACWAARLGGDAIRLSASRGFVLTTRDEAAARAASEALAGHGFVLAPDDPRGAVAACPGAPACASGTTATLPDAAQLAEAFRPFAARGLRAHVSGCAKGCAHLAPSDLTLVGEGGAYGIVLRGGPDALPAIRMTFEAALDRVRRADATLPLDQAFRTPS
ncbi:precorrin-3B synthase [Methylobacterium iners]|uniref:Nitrite/Sulfite reductase ferredoxin-like domain-containing protein n=1 Tax=Methylobacterium iners TaxID=418707 RepID=A0ABQ4S4S2_9HYPH|nr:precorrin-3B synthase [Methylobacterium iners]GJD96762.1 hypothetical protein OCOJLMKI_3987 [Methylobacterium iners]